MAVTIKCENIDDGLIHVNGKEVRQDMNGNWIGQTLENNEAKYFNIFLHTLIRCGRQLKSATYSI